MRQMRQITNNLFSADPFGGMAGMFGMGMPAFGMGMGLVPSRGGGFNGMNRLLAAPHSANGMSTFSSSSSVYCMSSNGNGQPQIYKETSFVKQGANGTRETRRTVEGMR